MELWFTETHSPGVRFSMKVTREIVRHQSDYQSICILDTEEFGRVLIMDDY